MLVAGAERLLSENRLIPDLEGPSGVSRDGVGGGGGLMGGFVQNRCLN